MINIFLLFLYIIVDEKKSRTLPHKNNIKNLTKRPAPAREEEISRTKVFFHLKNQVVALLNLYKNRYQYSVSTSSPTVEQRCTADAIEDEIYFFLHCDLFTHIH